MLKDTNPKKLAWRLFFYLFGLMVLAYGSLFSINSNLGVSPITSLPYSIHQALETNGVTRFTLGTCVTAVYCVYVLLQILVLRRSYKLINLLQLAVSTFFGVFIDFAKWTMGDFAIPTYAGRLLMLAISIVLIATGISFYLGARLLPMPSEGLGLALEEKLGRPYSKIKVVLDCCSVLLAITVGLVFAGRINGVREGTVITALLVGPVIGFLGKWIKPLVGRLCFGAPKEAEA